LGEAAIVTDGVTVALIVIVTSEPIIAGEDEMTRTLYVPAVTAPAGMVNVIGLAPVFVAIGARKLPVELSKST